MPNHDHILSLKKDRFGKLAKLRATLDKAELETRSLSRRERNEVETLEQEIESLASAISKAGGALSGPQTQAGGERQITTSDGPGVGPEERFADAVRERTGGGDWGDEGEFRLGACIRAMASGSRGNLNDVEARALAEGVDSAGGFLIAEALAAEVIDRLRPFAQVIASGARTIEMPGDVLNVARMTGGSTANWKSENQAVSESNQTYDRITFRTHTCVVLQKLSVELFEDLSEQANATIEGEVLQALALKLDFAALLGAGVDPEPSGITTQANTVTQSMGTNGAQLAGFDDFTTAVGTIAANNSAATGVILNARTNTFLNKLKDSTGQSLRPPAIVGALPFRVSNQIGTTDVQGTSGAVCSKAFVGAWQNLWIGVRPTMGIRIRLLQDRYADNLQYAILAWLRADIQLSHPETFVTITGIKP